MNRIAFISIGLFFIFAAGIVNAGDSLVGDASAIAEENGLGKPKTRKPEDTIPVVEIKGTGKPMTSEQIRQLEEISNGGPLDIKVDKTWVPVDCPRRARRLDFVTFHYKGFSETGKKFDQTYGRTPNGVRIQLGVGMVMPGLEKGLRGMCDTELRKIQVPHRLSRKNKSKVWKNIPNSEHWITFNIEMMHVEEWTIEKQFEFMDLNNDSFINNNELVKWSEKMRKEFGKPWGNEDIDNVIAAKYYIKYFDVNQDGKVDLEEFRRVFERDMATMAASSDSTAVTKSGKKEKIEGRKRDPGFAWILDFNNDGIVSVAEMDSADEILQADPAILPRFVKEEL